MFLSEKLDEIKAKRDRLRRKAELSKMQSDMVLWRKQVAFIQESCFAPFTLEELRLAIKLQRVRKSPEDDNIHLNFLKHMSDTYYQEYFTLHV
ncbi:hypothetical protein CEXT_109591 [Caerostris extrusa]|uniref:Uncharacterized protein n=1 Tax=Caerostris extrusa TaxID=172846 RepID=A0AAV4M988_CAEEX|nr:hypothetical protein CEXT_109591 [Caerostris extrusa]